MVLDPTAIPVTPSQSASTTKKPVEPVVEPSVKKPH